MIRYLSKEGFAAMADLSVRSVDELHRRGEGPPRYKFGNRVKFKEDEVVAWLASQRLALKESA